MARQAQQAAYDLSQSGQAGPGGPGNVPVNPWLNIDDPSGRRYEYRVTTRHTLPGETRPWVRTPIIDSGRLLTLAEIQDLAYAAMMEQTYDGEIFGFGRAPLPQDVGYTIESIMRRF